MKRVQKALLSSSLVLVIGAGAGAYAWFEGYKKNQKLESQVEQDKRLFSFGRIHLARIELKNEHGLFVFEKNDNFEYKPDLKINHKKTDLITVTLNVECLNDALSI